MHISGPGHIHGAHGLQGPHAPRSKSPASPTQPNARPATIDKLDISAEAASAADAGEIRTGRVAEIRAQIANGTYETQAKLDAAVSNLLDEIG